MKKNVYKKDQKIIVKFEFLRGAHFKTVLCSSVYNKETILNNMAMIFLNFALALPELFFLLHLTILHGIDGKFDQNIGAANCREIKHFLLREMLLDKFY